MTESYCRITTIVLTILCINCFTSQLQAVAGTDTSPSKPRIIVTTDGEGDDQCSMVRFLLYANEWDLQGIVFSSSKHHWKGEGDIEGYKWLGMEWLDKQLEAYAEVYPNLKLHDETYPCPEYIKSQVYVGNILLEGDMREATPGSDHIAKVLLQPDTSPIWLQAWGGPNTIARALKTIQEDHPNRMAEVSKKVRIFLIAEQDKTYRDYIKMEWPGIMTLKSGYDSYGGISYRWKHFQTLKVLPYFEPDWLYPNILENHGPLGASYLMKKNKYRSEGDSPAFLHCINTGLRSLEHPGWGGWGGRFYLNEGAEWKSADKEGMKPHTILRWAIDFQNDWAARADWCLQSTEEANHPPKIKLDHDSDLITQPGQRLRLSAEATQDADGDTLHFTWWQHRETGRYSIPVRIETANQSQCTIILPEDASKGDTYHMICTVRDNGAPVLTRYARVIISIND